MDEREASTPYALVTGAGGDIGVAIARALVAAGLQVVMSDLDPARAQHGAEQVPGATAVELDVRSAGAVHRTLADLIDANGPLTVLVNNAAVCANEHFEAIDEPTWSADLDVVLGGAIRMCQAVLPSMRQAGRGVVLNVASVNGHRYFGHDVYSAAKAGLINLTRALAVQYGPFGVRINSVSPGTIATRGWDERLRTHSDALEGARRWYPMGRVGTPEDVANAVAFLASDRASWITGTDLVVDGGLLAGTHALAVDIGTKSVR
ncbi:SDR family oxidoreductase [Micromonospora yasonensis]|uniref:SDR family NAD(P)-dependent oxidoreductase n=1 Tax=Micromonospora yasonensis TaxID=1128667 RepID=UPI0022308E62|nr:SDR family oxidoreductase [Micromonospora yasonensis]MCW3838968.1 SDR family oxidoreductase [Micromonospora yasonensis]